MTITYALIQMVEKISERTDRARILTKSRAIELISHPGTIPVQSFSGLQDVIGLLIVGSYRWRLPANAQSERP